MLAKTERRNVRQVAEDVRKSGALVRAEDALAAARAKRDAAHKHVLTLIGVPNQAHAVVNAATAEEAACDAEVREIRQRIIPLRAAHADAIKVALAPLRRAAAERILELIDDLRPELAVLDQAMSAIERAGGETVRVPPIGLDQLQAIARRLVAA